MNIQLKHIQLTNFKGIRSFSTSFGPTTNIFGDNATGKTSLFDAFLWLLFGKDSTDRKDFEVKTLDANNRVIPEIDHEVAATLDVDGQVITLKRVFREKWVKKRGNEDREFSGNENIFFWNEVPVQLGEWQKKIAAIVEENLFKLITNTLFFNQMKWQDRRNVLMQLAGKIEDVDIIGKISTLQNKQEIMNLTNVLNSGKTLEEYRRQLSSQKKLLVDALKAIPTRIDEANRSMPAEVDYVALEAQKTSLQEQIHSIDSSLNDATVALRQHHEAINVKQNQLHALNNTLSTRQQAVKHEFTTRRQQRSFDIQTLQNDIRQKQTTVKALYVEITGLNGQEAKIASYNATLQNLRAEWEKTDVGTLSFTDDQFTCPTCKRAMDETDIYAQKATMEENFNTSKSQKLSDIQAEAEGIKKNIATCEASIAELNSKLATQQAELDGLNGKLGKLTEEHTHATSNEDQQLNDALATDELILELRADIAKLQNEINEFAAQPADNTELSIRKGNIARDLEYINKQLGTKEHIERTKSRIEDLQKEERSLAQQIADLEKTEFQIEQFNRAKMDTLEARINGRFKLVKFKLFQTQINGGEAECCETLINGVPFSDANNASKINAGLDIINTLCEHHNVHAPIFIDNRESVNMLIESDSQIVNLIVSTDKALRVAA